MVKIIFSVILCFILIEVINKIFKIIQKKKNNLHFKYLNSLLNVIVITIILYTLAQQFEVSKDISKTLLQSGSLILAIVTFAAQQTLGNVISGFSLSISKPFDVGQKVKVMQSSNVIAEGIIKDITIRHTIINTFDGQSCILPNSIMDSAVIINTNLTEHVGNFLEVEVSYDSNINKAISLIKQICVNCEETLNDENTSVLIKDFSANGVILKTTIWTNTLDENFKACSKIRGEILKEFKRNHIEIPYQVITIDSGKI